MNKKIKPRCSECGAVFEAGDEVYGWGRDIVCGECFERLFSELERIEKALAMGCEVGIFDGFTF